jgi:transcriptional regulator with XRE-family HTH domain
MRFSAGKRLHLARELMGISRSDFAEMVSIKYLRLVTIENERGRMSVEDLTSIVLLFPELLSWLVLETPLTPVDLAKSDNKFIRVLADNLETHGMPEVKE